MTGSAKRKAPTEEAVLVDVREHLGPEGTDSGSECLEFWESDQTRPAHFKDAMPRSQAFPDSAKAYLQRCMAHPTLPKEEIRAQQLRRMKDLVELAYDAIPVYRDKYDAANFAPSDLQTFDDIQKIPVITKPELIAAFPDRCVDARLDPDDLFPTRSSGSSGQILLIRVNYDAILTDTLQGVRQFALQSGGRYAQDDLLTHVYTVPWWYSSLEGQYRSSFISNVIPPARVAAHLRQLSPQILSLYPSNLEALMPYTDEFRSSLYLAVTHSEQSSRRQRDAWSQKLGVPVLDEYSSEEGTRIALELPTGHYHVCEDTVHLDILDPATMQQQVAGRPGLSVITNLLNEAMPFIRYVQGDLVTAPAQPAECDINWSQLASIDGRVNDAFINKAGRNVPAGSLLDVTYRWMFDSDLYISQFELLQTAPSIIKITYVPGEGTSQSRIEKALPHLERLLALCMEHPVMMKSEAIETFSGLSGKRRPIRRDFAA